MLRLWGRQDRLPPNELRISRCKRVDHILKSLESRARSGRLHPTITASRDSPPDDRSRSYPISYAEATCHHHARVGLRPGLCWIIIAIGRAHQGANPTTYCGNRPLVGSGVAACFYPFLADYYAEHARGPLVALKQSTFRLLARSATPRFGSTFCKQKQLSICDTVLLPDWPIFDIEN